MEKEEKNILNKFNNLEKKETLEDKFKNFNFDNYDKSEFSKDAFFGEDVDREIIEDYENI